MRSGSEALRAPEHLTAAHDVSAFDCGVADLDEWLKKRALANEQTGASRTYVVCAGGRVVGYYAAWRRCKRPAACAETCRIHCP
jgi:hypothetical protein